MNFDQWCIFYFNGNNPIRRFRVHICANRGTAKPWEPFQCTTQKSTFELYKTSLKYFEKIFEHGNLLVMTHSFDVCNKKDPLYLTFNP